MASFNSKLITVSATFTPTAAADYTSNVVIPTGAFITRVIYKAVSAATPLTGGTNVALNVGGTTGTGTGVVAVVATAALPAASGVAPAVAQTIAAGKAYIDGTTNIAGKLTLTSTGTYSAGSLKVIVEYYTL